MANKKIYSRFYRIRKAYGTAFRVILSYAKLTLLSKVFGKRYYEKRIVQTHIRNANRIKKTILHLEGLFIKVGQLLSILSNFLPPHFQEPLEALQDQIPARPYPEIEARIVAEFGKQPDALFLTFDKTPLASASIGQVHRATLSDHTEVAVKVQHANIEQVAEVDLQVMQRLVQLISWFYDIKGIEHAYTQVKKMVEEELNYQKEAMSMDLIRQNLAEEQGIAIPKIYPDFSTARILTTSFHEGVKISNVEQLEAWDLDRNELARKLVHAYCQMVFKDGFYHADPHPGNILIEKNGTIVLLDFGATGTLPPEMRTGFLNLIEAAAKNDADKIIVSLKDLGFISDDATSEKIARKVIVAFRNFLQNEIEFDGLSLKEIKVNPFNSSLFNLTTEIGLKGIANTVQVPKEYVLLNRMVTLLMGICNTLDSHINPIEVVRPYFQTYLLGEKDPVKFFMDLLKGTMGTLFALPGDLRQTLTKINQGDLVIKQEGQAQQNRIFLLLGQQFIYTILLVATLGFAYTFFKDGQAQWSRYALGVAGVFVFLLFRGWRRNSQLLR